MRVIYIVEQHVKVSLRYVYHGLTHKLKTSIIRPYVSMTSIVLLSILRKSMGPIKLFVTNITQMCVFFML